MENDEEKYLSIKNFVLTHPYASYSFSKSEMPLRAEVFAERFRKEGFLVEDVIFRGDPHVKVSLGNKAMEEDLSEAIEKL
jgi:hypothetical protein